jgi:hypothetical protein
MAHSQGFRDYCPRMEDSGSLSIVVTQARSDTSPSMTTTKASESSFAVEHWLTYDIMLKRIGAITTKDDKGITHVIGQKTEISVNKGRGTGKMGKLPVPIYIFKDLGIDNLTTNIEYLKIYGIVKGSGYFTSPWNPSEINDKGNTVIKKMRMKELIEYIEDNNLEEEVEKEVEKIWLDVELNLCQSRKKKFG